ncbi:MAG TPA: formylglycine-generating enzyme family protein [Polyangiaceae bacterium]|jgi:formylglycine-generating enzyme required for sulfatase activity|nr:formylglycine-generating enzyme family protein [Polyangiaceae bacterium]
MGSRSWNALGGALAASTMLLILHPNAGADDKLEVRSDATRGPQLPTLPSFADALSLVSPLSARVYFGESSFRMGSTRAEMDLALADCAAEVHGPLCELGHFNNEGPERLVRVSAFTVDRFEVTQADYERCVAARRCEPVPYFRGAERFKGPRLPVSLVTWDEARDYCHFAGAELPTEAQWERAARGLGQRRYPWGNLYHSRRSNHGRLAWDETDDVDGFRELAPVGSYASGATPERIFDLAGNVEEWAFDRYDAEYDPNDLTDPHGATTSEGNGAHAVRGGSYTSPRARLRGASRTAAFANVRDPSRGFRCAASASPEASPLPPTTSPAPLP